MISGQENAHGVDNKAHPHPAYIWPRCLPTYQKRQKVNRCTSKLGPPNFKKSKNKVKVDSIFFGMTPLNKVDHKVAYKILPFDNFLALSTLGSRQVRKFIHHQEKKE